MPKVTVIVPNYNYSRYLNQRIQSILNQTFGEWEAVILDDASHDNSLAVITPFLDDPRISLIASEHNSGNPFKQWNKGLKLATTDYVWIAEADDYADITFLDRTVDILDSRPNIGLVYCQSTRVDARGKLNGVCWDWTDPIDSNRWRSNFTNGGLDECRRYLVQCNTIPNVSAVLLRRSVLEKVGYADESYEVCADWQLWIDMLQISDIAFLAKPMNFFRTHPQTIRSRHDRNGILIWESYKVIQHLLGKGPVDEDALDASLNALATALCNRSLTRNSEISFLRLFKIMALARTVDPDYGHRMWTKGWHRVKAGIGQWIERLSGRSAI